MYKIESISVKKRDVFDQVLAAFSAIKLPVDKVSVKQIDPNYDDRFAVYNNSNLVGIWDCIRKTFVD